MNDGRSAALVADGDVTLRPERPEDEEFLCRLYASTRLEELRPVPWSEADKAAFLRMQFTAQRRHYRERYADASFAVVERGDRRAGRLYLQRRDDEIRIVDISLLPEHRGHGVGTRLLGAVMEEARATGRAVRIHVERTNRALGLYLRLGFTEVADRGVYLLLEWGPRSAGGWAAGAAAEEGRRGPE